MKRINAMILIITLILSIICVPRIEGKAADLEEPIDGSYLIEDDYSKGEAINITRGVYLKSGTSSIAKAGTGKITAGGRTVGQSVVSTISVMVRVDRLVNGSWTVYTSWTTTKSNAAMVSSSKTLSVPTGYYYRVYCIHKAETDKSGSFTDGIYI